jgi:3-oxoacyl-[acyl-carrier-protein] synthase II
MNRVVITGLGTVNPCGHTVESTWGFICEGKSAVRPITLFDPEELPIRIAAEVKDFNPSDHMSNKIHKRLDRFSQFAIVAAQEALSHARLEGPLGRRAGVYIGTGIGGIREISSGMERMSNRGYRGLGAYFIPKSLSNLAGAQVALTHGATGPNICISTACAAGNHSIGEAFLAVQYGRADIMIAGGTESAINSIGMGGFSVMKALSTRNDEPERASRPFDVNRDGFVMGEGAGILILESLQHAEERGAKILAELVGYAQNNDAFHVSSPRPRHSGAAECMQLALENAGINASSIDYINAHGTSTASNDVNESWAIEDVFGSHRAFVSSTKGATGHLLGAAGGIEAVVCVQALINSTIPPSINIDKLDPDCTVNIVANLPKKESMSYVMSNGFGFGGTNGCLIFKCWEGK